MVRRSSHVTLHAIAMHNHHRCCCCCCCCRRRRRRQHVQQVRSSSDMTSSSFTPIVGCYQIELRRYGQPPNYPQLNPHAYTSDYSQLTFSATPLSNRTSSSLWIGWTASAWLTSPLACPAAPPYLPHLYPFHSPACNRILFCFTPALFSRVIFPRYFALSSSFAGAGSRQCVHPWPGCPPQETAGAP